jgi:Na+/H+-translocating membrane pyrophosphatase
MSTGDTTGLLSLGTSIVGLLAALSLYLTIVRQPAGTERMQSIAAEIHLGAMTYLREQYIRIGRLRRHESRDQSQRSHHRGGDADR